MKVQRCWCFLLLMLASAGYANGRGVRLSAEQAVEIVSKPGHGLGNMSPFELQVTYRMANLLDDDRYKYSKKDADVWNKCMRDEQQSMYARLCAAGFLLDTEKAAREFIEAQVASKNIRHRYNAAEVVEMYVGRDPKKTWGVDLLIRLVSDGSIDRSGVESSPGGDFPDGDRDDIIFTPIDGICWSLGYMKEKKAVPALIAVLKRAPRTRGAAFALGEIGDSRAIPILMRILKDRSGYEHREVTACERLGCGWKICYKVGWLRKLPIFRSSTLEEAMEGIGLAEMLSAEELAEAKRSYEVMKQAVEGDLWRICCLLAGKRDDELFGRTEFEVREEVLRIGAKAVETAANGRKKRGTKGAALCANVAQTRASSDGVKRLS